MHRAEDALSNRLKGERLDVFMATGIEGPLSKNFDFSLVLDEWAKKNRRILNY